MKKLFLPLLLILGIAYFTKPDDKTCIIEGVKAVWGRATPEANRTPEYFEQFMNLNSKDVVVKDRVFFKQVTYRIGATQNTVAYGAFRNVFTTVKPMEAKKYIPPMPGQQ